MMDPNFLAQRPIEWRDRYLFRPISDLPKDVALLYDAIYAERKEKITIQARLSVAHRRLDSANIKLWVMGILLAGEGAAILKLFEMVMK